MIKQFLIYHLILLQLAGCAWPTGKFSLLREPKPTPIAESNVTQSNGNGADVSANPDPLSSNRAPDPAVVPTSAVTLAPNVPENPPAESPEEIPSSPPSPASSTGSSAIKMDEQIALDEANMMVTGAVSDAITGSLVLEPMTLAEPQRQPWLVTPEECIRIAIERSKVLRDVGGSILQGSESLPSIHDPAITTSDPRIGVDAALSAFDAQFASRAMVENNDYAVNNRLLGGGANIITQDLFTFQSELNKKTATGTNLFFRTNTFYDANTAPGNLFGSAWTQNLEAGFRQPLGQGRGINFNRIAGPNATPGNYNGVLIARVSGDISITDFEVGLQELVSDVENAYWDLYFAYRNLEARIAARDAALDIWRSIKSQQQLPGGVADKEAQAREQYFRYQAEVQEAMTGRILDGTRTANGSSGGTFRGATGVHVAERRLRLLMNLPVNDGMMLRPAQDPIFVRVLFDWNGIATESLAKRADLRKQMLLVRRREMEVVASKNFLLPQLDAMMRYRIRGFGKDLIDPDGNDPNQFDNAWENLTSGNFQEWQFGLEMKTPIGFRQAYAGVRNAQLKLARERDVLDRRRQRVLHDLSNAYADAQRAYELTQMNFNRREAAHAQLTILRQREAVGSRVDLNLLLDAQNRAVDADSQYYGALTQYMLAIKNIHFEKGTVLEYNNVHLADRVHPTGQPFCPTPEFPRLKRLSYVVHNRWNRLNSPPTPARTHEASVLENVAP